MIRAAVLCQVLLLLTEPTLTLTVQSKKRPALWVLFDGTDSMNIADDLPPDIRAATDKAVGLQDPSVSPGEAGREGESRLGNGSAHYAPTTASLPSATGSQGQHLSRVDYLRALVQRKDENPLERLGEQFRLQAFLFESTPGVRSLELSHGLGPIDGKHVAEQLSAKGQVTDLGGALNDLAHRNPPGGLAGLIVLSDFNNTTGPNPAAAARQFEPPRSTQWAWALPEAVNLAATIVADPLRGPKMKWR